MVSDLKRAKTGRASNAGSNHSAFRAKGSIQNKKAVPLLVRLLKQQIIIP
jgi:hypothetical protein